MHLQVKSQLAAFGESMERDSAAQRGEVATLVQSAAERGKEFIDDTLQLSNVQASHCSPKCWSPGALLDADMTVQATLFRLLTTPLCKRVSAPSGKAIVGECTCSSLDPSWR